MLNLIKHDLRSTVQAILYTTALVIGLVGHLPGATFDESAAKLLTILQDPATPVEDGVPFTATGAESTRRVLSIARQTHTMKQEKPARVVRIATKDVAYGKYDTYAVMMTRGPQILTFCWYDPTGTGEWFVYAAVIEQNRPPSTTDRQGQ